MEIRRSYDRLISTMGFPILVRRHLYIESGLMWFVVFYSWGLTAILVLLLSIQQNLCIIRTVKFFVKTATIHQSKRLRVPGCTFVESMYIDFIHISLSISHAHHFILNTANLVANSGNAYLGFRVLLIDINWRLLNMLRLSSVLFK